MADATLQELGLSPLEGNRPQSAYTDFWTDTYLPAVSQVVGLDGKDRRRLARAAAFVGDVTSSLIHDQAIDGLGDFPDFLGSGPPSVQRTVTAWNKTLGSLNVMVDGQSDLLQAAGLLLAGNVDPEQGEFTPAVSFDHSDGYSSFTYLWKHNDLSVQRLNPTLLQAAELVHKASWIDEDQQRQDNLQAIAAAMYEQVCSSATLNPKHVRQAQNYMSDISFHASSTLLRQAIKTGDTYLRDTAVEQMNEQIYQDAVRLQDSYDQLQCVDSTRQGGVLFEDFAALALRKSVISVGLPEIEVRHAFIHEDHPLSGMQPKPAFDLVVQRHEPDRVIATPVQIKLSISESGSIYNHPEDYLPGIAYVEVRGVGNHELRQAAAALAADSGTTYKGMLEPLSAFTQLEDELGPLLLGE